jgi:hypothetical protein
MAEDNRSLARLQLTDIPPAPRGAPQIQVRFELDADAILRVSARELAERQGGHDRRQPASGLTRAEVEASPGGRRRRQARGPRPPLAAPCCATAPRPSPTPASGPSRATADSLPEPSVHKRRRPAHAHAGPALRAFLAPSKLAQIYAAMLQATAFLTLERSSRQIYAAMLGDPANELPGSLRRARRRRERLPGRDQGRLPAPRPRHPPRSSPRRSRRRGPLPRDLHRLRRAQRPRPARPLRHPAPAPRGADQRAGQGVSLQTAKDLLAAVVGDVFGRQRRERRRGRDIRYTLTVELAQAVLGGEHEISFEAPAPAAPARHRCPPGGRRRSPVPCARVAARSRARASCAATARAVAAPASA